MEWSLGKFCHSLQRTAKATTPGIEEEEEENIESIISESESDCIIVASKRSNLR